MMAATARGSRPDEPVAQAAALLAAGIHVFIFVLESARFTEPTTYRRFFVESQRDAELLRPIFFNQGFYNLFLAIGAAGGVLAINLGRSKRVGPSSCSPAAAWRWPDSS